MARFTGEVVIVTGAAFGIGEGAARRFVAVDPTPTCTAPTAGMKARPELIARLEERIPMGRGAQSDDIAGAIGSLASDDALFASDGQPALSRPILPTRSPARNPAMTTLAKPPPPFRPDCDAAAATTIARCTSRPVRSNPDPVLPLSERNSPCAC